MTGVDSLRSSNCIKQVCTKIVIQLDSGEQISFTAFQSVFNRIFEGEISLLSETDVAEKLLLLEELIIRYNSGTSVVEVVLSENRNYLVLKLCYIFKIIVELCTGENK